MECGKHHIHQFDSTIDPSSAIASFSNLVTIIVDYPLFPLFFSASHGHFPWNSHHFQNIFKHRFPPSCLSFLFPHLLLAYPMFFFCACPIEFTVVSHLQLTGAKRREFSGMIHFITSNNHPSNPQQPIHSLRLAPVRNYVGTI